MKNNAVLNYEMCNLENSSRHWWQMFK